VTYLKKYKNVHMKKPSVFAVHITNLTDARYFAAMGVQYIGFELADGHPDQVDLAFVKTITEWLEGPAIIGCVEGTESLNTLTKWVVDAGLDGLFLKTLPARDTLDAFASIALFTEWTPELFSRTLPGNLKIILSLEDYHAHVVPKDSPMFRLLEQGRIFVAGDFDDAFFRSVPAGTSPGLVLSGSEEEKTGFKSFDELDVVFEWIQALGD
jgi:phosphoribosylanthranilate isomerase